MTTPVKDMLTPRGMGCSTWPFATVAVVESFNTLYNHNPLVQLSEQQLVDCAPYQSCLDGVPEAGLKYLAQGSDGYCSVRARIASI